MKCTYYDVIFRSSSRCVVNVTDPSLFCVYFNNSTYIHQRSYSKPTAGHLRMWSLALGEFSDFRVRQQHSEATARSEHRGMNCSADTAIVAVSITPGCQFINAVTKLAVLTYTRSDIHQLLHSSATTSALGNLHSTSILQPHHCYTDRLPELTLPTACFEFSMLCSCRLEVGTLWTLTLCAIAL